MSDFVLILNMTIYLLKLNALKVVTNVRVIPENVRIAFLKALKIV